MKINNRDCQIAAPPPGIRRVYAEFLYRYDWDLFAHLTFARFVSEDRAVRTFNRLICWLNKKHFGRNFYKRGQSVRWARATERQACGRLHFHALIHGCGSGRDTADAVNAQWRYFAGDARVEPYTRRFAASSYLSKSTVFDGDLELGGSWPQTGPDTQTTG